MAGPSLKYTEQRLEAFPTRIFRRTFEGLEAFNEKMSRIILEKEATGRRRSRLVRSNVGGWHSDIALVYYVDVGFIRTMDPRIFRARSNSSIPETAPTCSPRPA